MCDEHAASPQQGWNPRGGGRKIYSVDKSRREEERREEDRRGEERKEKETSGEVLLCSALVDHHAASLRAAPPSWPARRAESVKNSSFYFLGFQDLLMNNESDGRIMRRETLVPAKEPRVI